ncbi:hypothetical protein K2X89_10975, partial [Myxococcota bacterium]|nr:hypothetical protein [Myxococcota bacterium]
LDDVVRSLSRSEAVTTASFRAAVERVAGGPVAALPPEPSPTLAPKTESPTPDPNRRPTSAKAPSPTPTAK